MTTVILVGMVQILGQIVFSIGALMALVSLCIFLPGLFMLDKSEIESLGKMVLIFSFVTAVGGILSMLGG